MVEEEIVGGREAFYPLEEGSGALVVEAPDQVVVYGLLVGEAGKIVPPEQGLDFGGQGEPAVAVRVVKRLYAEVVTG